MFSRTKNLAKKLWSLPFPAISVHPSHRVVVGDCTACINDCIHGSVFNDLPTLDFATYFDGSTK
jgi:hypothetical protein